MQPGGGQNYQVGGWYGGRQWNGSSLGAPGVINMPGQQGSGQAVSATVNAQSDKAQGLATGTIQSYVGNGGGNPNNQGDNNGGGSVQNGGFTTPNAPQTPNLQALYDQAYTNNPDVLAAQKNITDLQGQLTTRQKALDDATKEINDNPFYSEATRTGQLAKLSNSAQNDLNTITNQLNTAQAGLTAKQADAQLKINLASGQYNMDNQQYQQNLQNFNTLLSAGAVTNMSPTDLAAISAQTGISQSMLSSIQQTQQSKSNPLQIIRQGSNIVAVDKSTGQIVNQEQIGGGSGGGVDTPAKQTKATLQSFNASVGSVQGKKMNGTYVGQFPQLVAQYAPYMSLKDIYKAYSSSSLGQKYGTPKESAQDIKQIYSYYQGNQPKQTIQ